MNTMSDDIGKITMTTPFRVDHWLVSPRDHQARHLNNGETRPLEPRLMRLLCALAMSPQQVVERDLLIDTVWPRVVVNENSLTRAVSDLRKALQTADMAGKKLIETVPKRGYRLMADVEILTEMPLEAPRPIEPDSQPAPEIPAATALPQTQSAWHRWIPALAASLLLVITAVIQLPGRLLEPSSLVTTSESIQTSPREMSQPDMIISQPMVQARNALAEQSSLSATSTFSWHGEVVEDFDDQNSLRDGTITPSTSAVLAPEGNLLAYVEHDNNASRLMLRPTYNDAKPWTAFTTDETILQLQWSPLGDGILFTLLGTATAGSQNPGHHYRRLMLLDIQSLALHELYRKDDNPAANANHSGNLT